MKTKETIFRTQKALLFFIIFPIVIGMSSCQKDKTLDIDITEFKWELRYIRENVFQRKKPDGNSQTTGSYIFRFESDTNFRLPFWMNDGGGNYLLPTKGSIEIKTYSNWTEAAMTEFDELLLDRFIKMTSYTVKGNTLTFKGDNSEVVFRKIKS